MGSTSRSRGGRRTCGHSRRPPNARRPRISGAISRKVPLLDHVWESWMPNPDPNPNLRDPDGDAEQKRRAEAGVQSIRHRPRRGGLLYGVPRRISHADSNSVPNPDPGPNPYPNTRSLIWSSGTDSTALVSLPSPSKSKLSTRNAAAKVIIILIKAIYEECCGKIH